MIRKPSRQQVEFAYSLLLVIGIPVAITVSAIWLTNRIKSDFDQELRRKANLANQVFGVSAVGLVEANDQARASTLLQRLIDQTRSQAPEIEALSVSVPAGGGFTRLADSDPEGTGQADTSIQTRLAWSKNRSVASLVASGESQNRQWLVATPLMSTAGSPVAVAVMRVSLQASDELITATLRATFIGLGVLVGIIMLLLLNHFRFVQYAELFRQQRELARMKDDFISIATHELKAPMGVIRGYLSLALEEQVQPTVREMLQIGYDQTTRLTRLVADLLDVSRLEQGRTKYAIQPIDVPPIIQPLLVTYQAKAKDKKIGLDYAPAPGLPRVSADPDRVNEIFTNLIDNAIKYSRTGSVTIAHTVTPSTLRTTVSDTGIGMTSDELNHLFTRFYRARNDDTKDIAGTGLGLWIIKQYAEAMGGDIAVQSTKGQGTTFTVTLPITR